MPVPSLLRDLRLLLVTMTIPLGGLLVAGTVLMISHALFFHLYSD